MEKLETTLKDAYLIKPKVYNDERGFFMETYSKKKFAEMGIEADFVQDNHSKSVSKGVLRGLHYQLAPHTQAKLVRVTKGAVYDVIVDLRKDSPTFGKWEGFELTANNFLMLFVPKGFAHGFYVLEGETEFQYKCDDFYYPESEGAILWNDEDLKIYWPSSSPILSVKDATAQKFAEFNSPFTL